MKLARIGIPMICMTIFSCGTADGDLPTVPSQQSDDIKKSNAPVEKTVTLLQPNSDYYQDQLHTKMFLAKNNIAEDNRLIWLNFDGGRLSLESFLTLGVKCDKNATIPMSELSMKSIQTIRDNVKKQFDYGTVEIVDTEPKNGTTFSTVFVGGTSDSIGCGDSLGPSSAVAVKDPNNAVSNDIGIVFEDSETKTQTAITRLIAHMIGVKEPTVLKYKELDVDQIQRLQTIAQATAELNDEDVLDISHLKGELNQLVPEKIGDLKHIAKVITVLVIAGTDKDTNKFDLNKAKDILADTANSPEVGTLAAIAAAAGTPQIGSALDLAKIILGGGTGNTGNQNTPTQTKKLPPIDEFLELDYSRYTAAEVLGDFNNQAAFVNDEYSDQPEMIEMLILGHLQYFKKNDLEVEEDSSI